MKKKITSEIVINAFGTAPEVVPKGYSFEREFTGTADQAQFRFGGEPVVLVQSAEVQDKPGVLVIGVFSWKPKYEPYKNCYEISNLVYPDGTFGSVSNAYDDKNWRICREVRLVMEIGDPGDKHYPTRDAAARAELLMVNAAFAAECVPTTATQDTPAEQTSSPQPSEPLKLFVVTLEWNPNNSEEGEFSEKVWATDDDAAIAELAERMADDRDSGVYRLEDRPQFLEDIIAGARPHAVTCVADAVMDDISVLIAGPDEMTEDARADLAIIKAIMHKYGAK